MSLSSIESSSPSRGSRLLRVAVSLVLIAVMAPKFVAEFRPASGLYVDFVQEWLSARNFWSNHPIYESQTLSLERHTGTKVESQFLVYNAHPPVSVLIALPFGFIPDYRTAQLVWNLVTFPLFLLSLAMVAREFRVPFRLDTVFPALAGVICCFPVMAQIGQGQLNFLLLPLLVFGWIADRHGRMGWTGFCLGLAAGVKLFPAFLFVYLFCSGRWKALAVGIVTAVVTNVGAIFIFGSDAIRTYVRDVIPSLHIFRDSWRNASLTGFWSRLFGPQSIETTVMIALTSLIVVGVVVWIARRARTRSEADTDRAFAVTVVGMMLLSPLLWSHAFVLLMVPLAVSAFRLPPGGAHPVFLLLLPFFWVPEVFFMNLTMGPNFAASLKDAHVISVSLIFKLLVLPLFTYALIGLFLLTAFARWKPAIEETSSES